MNSYIAIMRSLTITNQVLERYFRYLRNFDNEAKKRLIIKLTNSLEVKEKPPLNIRSLFGAWEDNRTSDEIIEEIRASRL